MKIKKCLIPLILGVFFVVSFGIVSYAGEWQKDTTGYKYLENGRYIQSAWLRTPNDGSWYHFDNRGYMETGWILDGKWYYLDDVNGYMLSNRWIGNYYVGSDGAMLTSTTTPDGYSVGVDGAWTGSLNSNSITNSNVNERQKYLIKTATEAYLDLFGTGSVLKSTHQMTDEDIIRYMGTLIQNDAGLLTKQMSRVNYRQDGTETTEAYPISEVVSYTESFLGRSVPGNYRDVLYSYDFGMSDTHVGRVRADGEGYHTVSLDEYSTYEGKLIVKGRYYDHSSGGEILSQGTIVVALRGTGSGVMGMSIDFITLIRD